MSEEKINFSKDFASNPNSAMDVIFDFFPDHYPQLLSENENFWNFSLTWPTRHEWFVDPNVIPAAKEIYNLESNQIAPFYTLDYCSDVVIVTSMFHSRAILAPIYAKLNKSYTPISCIVHIDDHADLMDIATQSIDTEYNLYDTFYDQKIDFQNPLSVEKAINRGTISKGNFLTAYLSAVRHGYLLYINPNQGNYDGWLHPETSPRVFSSRKILTTGLAQHISEQANCWRIQQSSTLPNNLSFERYESIWLDIDLDVLCNRYNGDSDFGNLCSSEAEQKILNERLNLIESIGTMAWCKKIKAVSLAISPGFFPSDFWLETIPLVQKYIREIIC